MKVVSNTTPLRYLVAIQQEHLLDRLFGKVFVPRAVHEELTDSRTPEFVRERILLLPSWYEICPVRSPETIHFPITLHRGERDAIVLAETLHADVILIDEQIGRAIAMSRNLPVSGTLGVLERADKMGYIRDFPNVLQSLKASGFFVSNLLEGQLLERHRRRRGE